MKVKMFKATQMFFGYVTEGPGKGLLIFQTSIFLKPYLPASLRFKWQSVVVFLRCGLFSFSPSSFLPSSLSCPSSINIVIRSGEALKQLHAIFWFVMSNGLVLGESGLNHRFALKNSTSVCNTEIICARNLQVK